MDDLPTNSIASDSVIPLKSDRSSINQLSAEGADCVQFAFKEAVRLIERARGLHGEGGAGWAMRGLTMALASAFKPKDLAAGQASTIRGVRNAFSEEATFHAVVEARTVTETLNALANVFDACGVKIPDGFTLRIEINPNEPAEPAKAIPSCRDD